MRISDWSSDVCSSDLLNLAMAPPLHDGQVTFADGSPNTVKAMASDVAAFLVWTAEPKRVARDRVGWAAFIFLLIFTGLKIGRAACRERVSVRVALGGRRINKNKNSKYKTNNQK